MGYMVFPCPTGLLGRTGGQDSAQDNKREGRCVPSDPEASGAHHTHTDHYCPRGALCVGAGHMGRCAHAPAPSHRSAQDISQPALPPHPAAPRAGVPPRGLQPLGWGSRAWAASPSQLTAQHAVPKEPPPPRHRSIRRPACPGTHAHAALAPGSPLLTAPAGGGPGQFSRRETPKR